MELWNQRDLVPPVLTTFQCRSKHNKSEIKALVSTVNAALAYFEAQAGFDKAAAYASRFTTRWRNRFYNMHGFRLFQRLNQSLLRFRSVDIVNILTNLASLLPDCTFFAAVVDLPTRAYLDYVLVRLQGIAKLFCRIVMLAEEACKYYVRFMSTGYFFNLSSMYLCLLSEVWQKSRDMCKQTVEFYNRLVAFRSLLEVPPVEWPAGGELVLPAQLCTWLGDEWTGKINTQDSQLGELNLHADSDLFVLLNAEKVDLSTVQKIDAQIVAKVPALGSESMTSIAKKNLMERIKSDDGEVVIRKQEYSGVPATKNKGNDVMRILDTIKSKFDARTFLEGEKRKRRENMSQAVTCNIAAPAFNGFVASIQRDFNKLSTGDFLRLFREEMTRLLGLRDGSKKRKRK